MEDYVHQFFTPRIIYLPMYKHTRAMPVSYFAFEQHILATKF